MKEFYDVPVCLIISMHIQLKHYQELILFVRQLGFGHKKLILTSQ